MSPCLMLYIHVSSAPWLYENLEYYILPNNSNTNVYYMSQYIKDIDAKLK